MKKEIDEIGTLIKDDFKSRFSLIEIYKIEHGFSRIKLIYTDKIYSTAKLIKEIGKLIIEHGFKQQII